MTEIATGIVDAQQRDMETKMSLRMARGAHSARRCRKGNPGVKVDDNEKEEISRLQIWILENERIPDKVNIFADQESPTQVGNGTTGALGKNTAKPVHEWN